MTYFDSLSSGLSCLIAAWTLVTVSWSAWRHVRLRGCAQAKYRKAVAAFVKVEIENVLTEVLNAVTNELKSALINERDGAKAAFDNTTRNLSVCLESAQEADYDATAVVCSCGRPGHFKNIVRLRVVSCEQFRTFLAHLKRSGLWSLASI